MISKISIGSGIGGCLDYLMNPEKQFSVVTSNGISTEKKEAKKEFRKWASANETLKKNVLHIPLSFSPEDKSKIESDIEFRQNVINRYIELMSMKGYALNKTQFIAIEHNDTKHPHIHLVFNRVTEDGKTIRDNYIALNSKKICQQITREFNLTPAVSKTKNINTSLQQGKEKMKSDVYNIIAELKQEDKYFSLEQLKNRLSKSNITLELIIDENGKIFGSYYVKRSGDKQIKLKTSAIDKEFTLRKLVLQHELSIIRSQLQQEYNRRHKLKTVIRDIDYELTKYAHDESRMMDDLATIMSLGLFKKSPPVKKLKDNFASADELKTRREKAKSVLASMLASAIKSTHTFDDLVAFFSQQNIRVTNLNREAKTLISSGNNFFLSDEILPGFSYDYIHLQYETKDQKRKTRLIEALTEIKAGNSSDLEAIIPLLPQHIELIRTETTGEDGKPGTRLSFMVDGKEIRRNELPKELNGWLTELFNRSGNSTVSSPDDDRLATIRTAIVTALGQAQTQADFKKILFENAGIETNFKYDSTDTLVGVRFNLDDVSIKGSDLGLSAKAIKKQLPEKGSNDQKPNTGLKI